MPKPRYSAFFNTALDSMLRARNIRPLVFTGVAATLCVESTLRETFFGWMAAVAGFPGAVRHSSTAATA